jgi:hypothetical protein
MERTVFKYRAASFGLVGLSGAMTNCRTIVPKERLRRDEEREEARRERREIKEGGRS